MTGALTDARLDLRSFETDDGIIVSVRGRPVAFVAWRIIGDDLHDERESCGGTAWD